MTLEETRLADAMATAAQELHEPQTTAEVLDRLVHAVLRAVPAADFAGVTIADRSGVHTIASTAPVVDVLDQAQYELQEGPCLDAMRRAAPWPSATCDRSIAGHASPPGRSIRASWPRWASRSTTTAPASAD